MNTAVASLRGQDVSIRRSSSAVTAVTAEEDLRIETSCPLNEATAVFMLKNLCYHHTSHSDEPLSYVFCMYMCKITCTKSCVIQSLSLWNGLPQSLQGVSAERACTIHGNRHCYLLQPETDNDGICESVSNL